MISVPCLEELPMDGFDREVDAPRRGLCDNYHRDATIGNDIRCQRGIRTIANGTVIASPITMPQASAIVLVELLDIMGAKNCRLSDVINGSCNLGAGP
jgi:hypothetical protein